jgi:hypothetical protein
VPTALADAPGMAAGKPMPILTSVPLLRAADFTPASRAKLDAS